jgi:hypothetical protein
VRMYNSGAVLLPERNDCISISVLNRLQWWSILWFVCLGLGTKFKPNPKILVVFGGGLRMVQRLCTAALVQRTKKCDVGRFAIMLVALWCTDKYGLAVNP